MKYLILKAVTIFYLVNAFVWTSFIGDNLAVAILVLICLVGAYCYHGLAEQEKIRIKDAASMDRPE